MTDIISVGVKDGLIWYSFILGIGLLYSYQKHIDVSIDGVAIISGIVAALTWNASSSYFISILSSVITGVSCSILISFLISSLGIHPLMAGIVFSLAAHSISTLWVGESLSLINTNLLPGLSHIPFWLPLLLLSIAVITHRFYSTKFGIAIKRLGDGININHTYNPFVLQLSAYALSGALYGFSAALYSHSEGLARSGGGFEVLVVSLCAYLSVDRIIDFVSKMTLRVTNLEEGDIYTTNKLKRLSIQLLHLPPLKAIIGAIFFQVLAFFIIVKTPNPIYWKLVFSVILTLSLIKYDYLFKSGQASSTQDNKTLDHSNNKVLHINNLNMTYKLGIERRCVFNNASIIFNKGINLLRGPNGSGKSTFLGIVDGVITPDSASIYYGKVNILGVQSYKRPVFLIHQDPFRTLAPSLTVEENLIASLPNRSNGSSKYAQSSVISRLEYILKTLNLKLIAPPRSAFWNKPAYTLSGGQANYISFYCGLISECSILLADEPSTGLDEINFGNLVKLLSTIALDKIIIVTTHDERLTDIANTEHKIVNNVFERVF